MKKFTFILIWILSIVSCQKPKDPPSGFGQLEGDVYFQEESNPTSGLQIRVAGTLLTTPDSKGHFYLSKVPEGVQKLEVLYLMDPIYSTGVGIKSDFLTSVVLPLKSFKKDLPDFLAVDISKESTWDYWVVGKEEYFYIDAENSKPKSVFYHSFKNGKEYGITFDSKGLPSKVITEGFIFLFSNFNENKVDLGIISPSGESQIVRGIKTDFVWPTSSKSTQSRADVIRWTGRILGALPCVTLGAAALVTGGAAIPLALWACGNYLLKMTDSFFDDANVKNGFTETYNAYDFVKTNYECSISASDCLIGISQKALVAYADYIEEMDVRAEYIHRVEVLLANNTPSKKITLQPGPEGKDAWINKTGFDSPCREFYYHSGEDSLISVVYDDYGCNMESDEMLLQFSMDFVPINAVISSAELELYGYATINQRYSSPNISIYSLKSSWIERDVSWQSQPERSLIQSKDFISSGELFWHSWDVTNTVQDWVSERNNNFGFEIAATNNYVFAEFRSGDHPYTSTRPRLVISYYTK